jgi:VWFA-related protein
MLGSVLAIVLVTAPAARAQYQETITVARILLDVRVTDAKGNPILDLEPEDFDVKLGGKSAEVESVTWVDEMIRDRVDESSSLRVDEEKPSAALDDSKTRRLEDSTGRLIVVFIQTDFGRNNARVVGQMHFEHFAEEMMDALQPDDRVAVFSFDSHLKFRLDFTSNKSAVQAAMRESMLVNDPPWPRLVPNPALASRLNAKEMRDAPDSETALILVGNALRPIPGPKTMLLLGWGLGRRAGSVVEMTPKWTIARHVLDAARVSIFALDTTLADYHDLEIGLGQAAKETGGFYAKTHEFPQLAIDRLQRTLTGHYELELRRPAELKPGTHALDVRVKRRAAIVLAPSSWMDR